MFLAASAAVSGAAFAADNGSANIQAVEAYKALSSGDPEMAIANYSLAIEDGGLAGTELANALLNRALAHQQMNHHAEAVADYDRALKLESLTAEQRYTALYNRGLAHQKAGEKTAAVDDFTSALYLQPEFAAAYLARGNALRESGQNLFALSDYDKALRHNHPDKARVYYAQALAFAALKRPTDERKALELAVAANPGFAPATQRLSSLDPQSHDAKAADPVLTATSAPIGGSMTMKKPELPQAVAPPQELAELAAPEASTSATQSIESAQPKPAMKMAKVKKKYLDRIMPETEQAAALPAASSTASEVEPATASIEPASAGPESDTPAAAMGEETTTAELTGWIVQVASAASEDAAWSTYKKMQAGKKVLHGKTPVVVRADLGKKGIYYRVRFGGFDSQQAAQRACSRLKSGGVSCYVSRSNS